MDAYTVTAEAIAIGSTILISYRE